MSTFRITKPDSFKDFSFGERLIDILTAYPIHQWERDDQVSQ
jgi:hypothetical protein